MLLHIADFCHKIENERKKSRSCLEFKTLVRNQLIISFFIKIKLTVPLWQCQYHLCLLGTKPEIHCRCQHYTYFSAFVIFAPQQNTFSMFRFGQYTAISSHQRNEITSFVSSVSNGFKKKKKSCFGLKSINIIKV